MDSIVSKLNNRYLVAVIVLLFLIGVFKRFAGR